VEVNTPGRPFPRKPEVFMFDAFVVIVEPLPDFLECRSDVLYKHMSRIIIHTSVASILLKVGLPGLWR